MNTAQPTRTAILFAARSIRLYGAPAPATPDHVARTEAYYRTQENDAVARGRAVPIAWGPPPSGK